jgi:hypothetical protein
VLENNPYLLVRPSEPNGELSGIPLTFSINKDRASKEFNLYGMIRKSGSPTGGHYIYDRQDLESKKHIVYNDEVATLFDDKIQMQGAGGLNAYLLVYAEVKKEKSLSAKEEVAAEAPDAAEAPEADENAEEDDMEVVEDENAEEEDVKPASKSDLISIEKQLEPKSESVADPAFTALLSGKIKERLKVAQTIKDTDTTEPKITRIKEIFNIDKSIMDKNEIMKGILGNIKLWMNHIGSTDPKYKEANLDYITFLVLKSKIDAQVNKGSAQYAGKEISHEPSKKIAKDLIEYYKTSVNDRPSIDEMAEHIMEHRYFDQLQAAKELKAGGHRTLRAKKRTLRASKQNPKKRTLRASKKLRQLLNST